MNMFVKNALLLKINEHGLDKRCVLHTHRREETFREVHQKTENTSDVGLYGQLVISMIMISYRHVKPGNQTLPVLLF